MSTLNARQTSLLESIIDAIIPETTTPGALSLGLMVPLLKILADCYEKTIQSEVIIAIEQIDALAIKEFGQSFLLVSNDQKLRLLTMLLGTVNAEVRSSQSLNQIGNSGIKIIKELTIHCFITSEYVMKKFLGYSADGIGYQGCIPYLPQNLNSY